MHEKIRVDRVEVGMYVDSLCGKWIDHPFWRRRFLIRDEHDLAALRESGVAECWVDRSKGVARGVSAPDPAAARQASVPAPARDEAIDELTGRSSMPPQRVTYDEEIERAAAVCTQALRATQSLFREVRLGRAIELGRCAEVADQIAESATRHPSALVSLARVRTHHSYTFMHSVAVCALMSSLARHLQFDDDATRDAAMAGLLHDIGKAGVDRVLLDKQSRLSDDEFVTVKKHSEIGHRMLLGNVAASEVVLFACLHHHERFDGNGYPARLAGETIPYEARMSALCDVYDAITSLRAYKQPWDPAESIVKMAEWTKEGQFDATLFRAFAATVGIYPVGSLVRMKSGRLALVVDQNPQFPAQPGVKVFWSTTRSMPVRIERIDLAAPGAGDRIVARESNAKWGFAHLHELLIGEDIYRKFAPAA